MSLLGSTFSQQAYYSNLNQVPSITASQIVGIGLIQMDPNATFTILPNILLSPQLNTSYSVGLPIQNGLLNCNINFTNISSGYNNAIVYYGNISEPNRGDIIVQNMGGIISGIIQINQEYYIITPLNEGIGLIVKLNTDSGSFGKVLCGNIDSSDGGEHSIIHDDQGEKCFAGSECPAEITILVVFDQSAKEWMESFGFVDIIPNLTIPRGFFAVLNQLIYLQKSFINSQIDAQIKIKLQYYNGFTFTSHDAQDIITMGNNSYFKNLQISKEADIVINLANVNYTGPQGITYGISRGIGLLIDRAFAIIDIDKILGTPQLMSHEIGHLLGGRHNRPANLGDDPTDVCNHALVFTGRPNPNPNNPIRPQYSTNVTSGRSFSSSITPVMHFSNPEVVFETYLDPITFEVIDITTGRYDNDNAGIINENACQMSKANIYADMKPEFTPNYKKICTQLETFNQCIQLTIPPNGRNLQPPYIVWWYWNNLPQCPHLDLVDLEHKLVEIIDNDLCFNFPTDAIPSAYSAFYVCAKIEDANGNYITLVSDRIEKDYSNGCMHTTELMKKISSSSNVHIVNELAHKFSNNSIDIEELSHKEINYKLYNLDGRKISLPYNLELTRLSEYLPVGVYILKKENNESWNYEKLFIR